MTIPTTGTWSASTQISIHSSGSNNKPGDSLGTLALTLFGGFANASTTGIQLAANTTYFVVLTGGNAQGYYRRTNSDHEDSGAATGWSIGNGSLYGGSPWSSTSNTAWMVEISGYANYVAPTLSKPIPHQPATVGQAFSYAFRANTFAANGNTLTYTATKLDGTPLPAWLTFDAATRRFFGTPQASDIEWLAVRVTADAGNGGSVSHIFEIRVRPARQGPEFESARAHKSQVDVEWTAWLAYGSTVPSSAFTLTATKEDGSVQTIRGKADPVLYKLTWATFTVWLEEPVPSDAALTLSYTRPPDGQDQFRDRSGNVLESFSGKPVMSGRPRVEAVELVSDPGEDETYGRGDLVRFQVRFDLPVRVDVRSGGPRMHVEMDSDYYMVDDGNGNIEYRYGWAHYVGGSGTDTLSFALRVAANNYGDGISLRRNALTTYYGGRIWSLWPWSSPEADLSHAAFPHQPGHRVNGSVSLPKFQHASVAGNVLTLTFDRYLDTDPAPAPGDFHVTVDGAARQVSGVTVSLRTVRLTLASAVNLGQAVRVGYTRGANPLQDTSAREVESFADRTVTNNWAATLTVRDIGSGHRGCGLLAATSCESALTSHTFTKGSTSYQVGRVSRGASGSDQVLVFALNEAIPSDWTLQVADRNFPVSDATLSDSDRTATWTSPGFSWSVGQTVALRLTAGAPGASGPRSESPGAAATVTDVSVVSDPGADDTYGDGDTIRVRVTFSEAVEVDTSGGKPRLTIDMDPADWGEKRASYESGSGTTMLEFTHTVKEPNLSTGGIKVVADSLEPNGGGIRNAGTDVDAVLSHGERPHNPEHKVDWRIASDTDGDGGDSVDGGDGGSGGPPTVSDVVIVSDPGDDATYGLGDTIRVTATFSEAVNVTGTPRLKIDMDPADWGEKWAAYKSGNGTTALVFEHEVVEPNYSPQGIKVVANSLSANGGTIASVSSGTAADLAHAVRGHNPGHKVDWRPTISVADATAREGTDANAAFTVSLSRAFTSSGHSVTVDYATADGTATAGADYTATSGTLTFAAGESTKTVNVPILDDSHDEGEETFTLRLSNATGAHIGDSEATGTITNDDPLQQMWLSRFGRTVASDAVATVTARLQTPRDAGSHLTLAGQRLPLDGAGDGRALADALTGFARAFGAPPPQADHPDDPFARHDLMGAWDDRSASAPARRVTGRELLLGTSFRAVLASDAGKAAHELGPGRVGVAVLGRGAGLGAERRDGERCARHGLRVGPAADRVRDDAQRGRRHGVRRRASLRDGEHGDDDAALCAVRALGAGVGVGAHGHGHRAPRARC